MRELSDVVYDYSCLCLHLKIVSCLEEDFLGGKVEGESLGKPG